MGPAQRPRTWEMCLGRPGKATAMYVPHISLLQWNRICVDQKNRTYMQKKDLL